MSTHGAFMEYATARPEAIAVSVLVPVKDEEACLEPLVEEIEAAFAADPITGVPAPPWEVVLVDDGSDDGSWKEIVRLSESRPELRGLRLRRNFGKSAALAAGLRVARGRIIVTLDGDLQDDPAEVPCMIARLGDEGDLVTGHKADRRDRWSRRLASRLFNAVTGVVTGLRLRDHNCGLKVGWREVFESVPLYGEMHRYIAAVGHAEGFRVVEQLVNHRPRRHGTSKYGFERYLRGGLDLLTMMTLTRYGRRPAHLFGGVGLAAGIIGMVCLVYLTGVWFLTDQGIGHRPLLLFGVLMVLLAVQLLSIGLVAELLVHRRSNDDDVLRHVVATAGPVVRGDPLEA